MKERSRKAWRGVWDENGREKFRKKVGRLEVANREVGEEWREVKRKINREMEEEEGIGNEERKGRWDEKCKECNRKVRKELKKWRRKGGKVKMYRGRKKEYKEVCERKTK